MTLNPPPETEVSVIYHGDCQDGFGAALAAWLKYGDSAMYTPNEHGVPYKKESVMGKNVVMVDFSFKKEILDEISSLAKSLTILDHHQSAAEVVKSIPSSLFDNNHSGAYLAWQYFHPGKPIPKLISYIEDDDLYRFALPNSRSIREYVFVQPFSLHIWRDMMEKLDTDDGYESVVARGILYREHAEAVITQLVARAERVSFENHEILAVSVPRLFDSEVGNILARKRPPFSLLFKFHPDRLRVSLRGDGSIDVSKIAEKYGGGGHHDAAGFNLDLDKPFPFKKT